jgi:hypothetical protein
MTAPQAERALSTLTDDLSLVFKALCDTAAAFAASVAGSPDGYTVSDVALLRPRIRATLDTFQELTIGTGVVVAPGVLSDATYWVEWWWRPSGGSPEALRVSLDPALPDFFDYVSNDWFVQPIQTGREYAAGPYVDYECTNQYALTLSVAARHDSRPLGVVAMDIPSDQLERRIMPALCAEPGPRALVNASGRVIAANTARWTPGDRLASAAEVACSDGLARLCALTGWTMTALPS